MPIFPVLICEELVQENDKTRFDASQSYVSAGSPITKIWITPGWDQDAVDVTATRFLDWQFKLRFTVGPENVDLRWLENGALKSASIPEGDYSADDLAEEIQTQMNGAGTFGYTVTTDSEWLTISSDKAFTLQASDFFQWLGMDAIAGAQSHFDFFVGEIEEAITLTVETADEEPVTITRYIRVVSEQADRLFSTDEMLRKHEPDLLSYVPDGRNTFKDVHRRVQMLIMNWLAGEGLELTADQIADKKEIQDLAVVTALKLIFEGISNATDDVFTAKSQRYGELEESYRNRASITVSSGGASGGAETPEVVSLNECRVMRR